MAARKNLFQKLSGPTDTKITSVRTKLGRYLQAVERLEKIHVTASQALYSITRSVQAGQPFDHAEFSKIIEAYITHVYNLIQKLKQEKNEMLLAEKKELAQERVDPEVHPVVKKAQTQLTTRESQLIDELGQFMLFCEAMNLREYKAKLKQLKGAVQGLVTVDQAKNEHMRVELERLEQAIASTITRTHDTTAEILDREIESYHYKPYGSSEVQGTIYMRKINRESKKSIRFPKHAVLLFAGIFSSRKMMELTARRIVRENYLVYTIDMPSQGDSKGKWTMGHMCDFIRECSNMLRTKFQAQTVTCISQSAGAMAAVFSTVRYNPYIEQYVYPQFQHVLRLMLYMEEVHALRTGDNDAEINEKTEEGARRLIDAERKLEQLIVSSIQRGGASYGDIDNYIFLAPPDRFQNPAPEESIRLVGKIKPKTMAKIYDVLMNDGIKKNLTGATNPVMHSRHEAPERGVIVAHSVVEDLKAFSDYIANIKNPGDYLNILEFYARKNEVIRAFIEQQRKKPKLFVYGAMDRLLKGHGISQILSQGLNIGKKRTAEIEGEYQRWSDEGNAAIVRIPGLQHLMVEGDKLDLNYSGQLATDSRVMKLIVEFLHKHVPVKTIADRAAA